MFVCQTVVEWPGLDTVQFWMYCTEVLVYSLNDVILISGKNYEYELPLSVLGTRPCVLIDKTGGLSTFSSDDVNVSKL